MIIVTAEVLVLLLIGLPLIIAAVLKKRKNKGNVLKLKTYGCIWLGLGWHARALHYFTNSFK